MDTTEPTTVSAYTVPPHVADYEPATEMEATMKTALLQYVELANTQRQYIAQVIQERDDWHGEYVDLSEQLDRRAGKRTATRGPLRAVPAYQDGAE